MTVHSYVNTASTAAVGGAGLTSGATAATVSGFTGWPTTFPYWAEIAKGTASAEIVEVTAAAGTLLTIVRAQGGTLAAAHNVGDTFEHVAPAYVFALAESHAETTAAHGASSALVGKDDPQTLTAKTYRGKHLAVFSDANPTPWTAAFEVQADNTNAKDGFVHNNTGADPNRAAFRAAQSGADRFVVFNDGTAKVTPAGGAARPGFENAGTSKLTGAVVMDSNATVGGTLGVTGNTTVGGTLAVTGAVTVPALTTSGNASVGGTLTATGLVTAPAGVDTSTAGRVKSDGKYAPVYDPATDRLLEWDATLGQWVPLTATRRAFCRVEFDQAGFFQVTGDTLAQSGWFVPTGKDPLNMFSIVPSGEFSFAQIRIPAGYGGEYFVSLQVSSNVATGGGRACGILKNTLSPTGNSVARDSDTAANQPGGDGVWLDAWDYVDLAAGDILRWTTYTSVDCQMLLGRFNKPSRMLIRKVG